MQFSHFSIIPKQDKQLIFEVAIFVTKLLFAHKALSELFQISLRIITGPFFEAWSSFEILRDRKNEFKTALKLKHSFLANFLIFKASRILSFERGKERTRYRSYEWVARMSRKQTQFAHNLWKSHKEPQGETERVESNLDPNFRI